MNKILRYLRQITRMSFQTWMQYPQDIFASGIGSVGYTFMQLIYFYFLFTSGKSFLGGYTFQEFYTVFFISQWSMALFFLLSWDNLRGLGKEIEQGSIDLQLIKPLPTALLLQLPKLLVSSFMPLLCIQIALSILFLFIGTPDLPVWFLPFAFLLIVLGWLLLHTLFTISISLLFYFKGFWGLYKTSSYFTDLVQYPKDLFPTPLQIFFSFCIPYFTISDPLYKIFRGGITLEYILFYLLFYVVFLSIGLVIWSYGLKKYEGG